MRNIVLNSVIESLEELSDINCQIKFWAHACNNEISSFSESVCHLFNDSGLGFELDKNNIVFSRQIDDKMKELRRKLSLIDENQVPEKIIYDPLMETIRRDSGMILKDILLTD